MRKEATKKEWKKLYELAEQYTKMKPWELLDNEEIVCVEFSKEDKAYFTIMGNGGLEYGFGMYIGDMALHEMQLQIHADNEYDSDRYSLYMQNCVVMFMDKKQDVPPEQMKVISDLGLDFGRGRKWVYFETHTGGYLPYIPDQKEVQETIRFMEQLLKAFPMIAEVKPRGFHIMGHGYLIEPAGDEVKLSVVAWNIEELRHLPIFVENEEVKKVSAGWKKLSSSWEADLILMHSQVNDKKYDRPLFPYLLLIMDHKNGRPVYQKVLEPTDRPAELCMILTAVIEKNGRPKEIFVSGGIMKEILSPVEAAISVPVKIGPIWHLDEYRESLERDMMKADAGSSPLQNMGLKEDEIQKLLALAGAGSEEELMQMLSERVKSGFGWDDAMFDEDDPEDYDDEYLSDWQSSGSQKDRQRFVNDFFEHTYRWTGNETEEEDEEYDDEDLTSGMIEAEWYDDWGRVIGQCSAESLKKTAEMLEIKTGGKKAQLAGDIGKALKDKPAKVKEILNDTEKELLKKLRMMVNKGECDFSDTFPYTKETVMSLVDKGILDVELCSSFMGMNLRLLIPKELKGMRL